jgi:hypothetical protein
MKEERKPKVFFSPEGGHFRIEIPEAALASGVAKLLTIISEQLCQVVVLSESLHGVKAREANTSYDERKRRQLRAVYHFLLQNLPQDHKTLVDFQALFYQSLVQTTERAGEQSGVETH